MGIRSCQSTSYHHPATPLTPPPCPALPQATMIDFHAVSRSDDVVTVTTRFSQGTCSEFEFGFKCEFECEFEFEYEYAKP